MQFFAFIIAASLICSVYKWSGEMTSVPWVVVTTPIWGTLIFFGVIMLFGFIAAIWGHITK